MSKLPLKGVVIGFDDFDANNAGAARVCVVRRDAVVAQFTLADAPPELLAALSSDKKTSAVTAAPHPSATISLPLENPQLAPAKFARILPRLLDAHLPIPVAECSLSCIDYDGAYMAYVTRNSDLQSRLTSLSESGIDPVRILPLAHCVWELALDEYEVAEHPLAIAITGESQTLIVAGAGDAPETQVICKTDPAEIAARVRLAFMNAERTGKPASPLLVAAGARASVAAEAFKSAFPGAQIVIPDSPEFFAAKALALDNPERPTSGNKLFRDPNLRTGAFAHKSAKDPAARLFTFTSAALLIFAAALFAVSYHKLASVKRMEQQSAAELKAAVNTTAGYNVTSRGQRAVDDAKTAAPSRIDPAIESYRLDSVANTLDATMRFCDEHGIKLKSLSIAAGGVCASGESPDAQAPAALAKLLSDIGFAAQLAEPPKQSPAAPTTFQFMIVPLK
ncbi:MAG: hypothetical protein FWG05_01280 [Kiritimatiellaeota bacterium]|nr:hypothetical protein [Kiritimatiellota bacterium]